MARNPAWLPTIPAVTEPEFSNPGNQFSQDGTTPHPTPATPSPFKNALHGLPRWFSGKDATLPTQGGPGSLPGRGTRSHVPQLRLGAAK